MFTGVTTIGARRAGGGLAGKPYVSNVREAAAIADERRPGLVILEGSGAAVPPVPWDAGILVCGAATPPEFLGGYLGPYRVLLSDLIVFTMGTGPDDGPQNLSELVSHVARTSSRCADRRHGPHTRASGRSRGGRRCSSRPRLRPRAGASLVASLEERHGCTVVGLSHKLADRAALGRDLDGAPTFEVLVTELKAAAVDVAAERAIAAGAEVVLMDNRPETVDGDERPPGPPAGGDESSRQNDGRNDDPTQTTRADHHHRPRAGPALFEGPHGVAGDGHRSLAVPLVSDRGADRGQPHRARDQLAHHARSWTRWPCG